MPKQLQWGFSGLEDAPDTSSHAAGRPVSAATDSSTTAPKDDHTLLHSHPVSGHAPSGHPTPLHTGPSDHPTPLHSAPSGQPPPLHAAPSDQATSLHPAPASQSPPLHAAPSHSSDVGHQAGDVVPPMPVGRSGLMPGNQRPSGRKQNRPYMPAQVASLATTGRVSGTNTPLDDVRAKSISRPRASVSVYGAMGTRNQQLEEPTISSMQVPSVSPDVLAKQARHNAQLEQEHQVSAGAVVAIRKAALRDVLEAVLGVTGPQLDNYQLDLQAVVSAVNGKITRSLQETEATMEAKIAKKYKAQQDKLAQESQQKAGRSLDDAKRKMDERIKQLLADTKRLNSQVDALEKEKSSIYGKAAQASRELKDKDEQINALKTGLTESEAKAERQGKQILKMEQTIVKVRNDGIQQAADLGARLKTTQTALENALRQLEESRCETAHTQHKGIEALQAQREALETHAANTLAAALEEAREQHQALIRERFEAIEETMLSLLAAGRAAEQMVEEAINAGYALGRDLEFSVGQLQDEQKLLKGDLVKGMHALYMDAKNFAIELKGLAEDSQEHTNMALRVHKRLDELGPDGVDALMTELENTKLFLKQARQEVHDLEAHLSQETKRSKRLSDEKSAMIQELRRQESMCKDLRDNIAALRQVHEGVNQQLTAARKEVIDTQNKVLSKQKEVNDLNVLVQERDKQLGAVQRAFANNQDQLKKLNEAMGVLQQQQSRMILDAVWSAAGLVNTQISGLHKRYFHGSPPMTKGQQGSASSIIQSNALCRLSGEEITAASQDFIERNQHLHSRFRPALAESKAAIPWLAEGLQEEEDDDENTPKDMNEVWKQEVESNLLLLEGAVLNVLMDLRAKERELDEVATAVQGALEEGAIEKKPQNKSWPQKRPDSSGAGSSAADMPTVTSLTAQMLKAMASERREMQRLLRGGANNVDALNSRSHNPTPMMYRHLHHDAPPSSYRHSDTNVLFLSTRAASPPSTASSKHTAALHSTTPARASSPVIGSTTNLPSPASTSSRNATPPKTTTRTRNRGSSPTNSSSGSPRESDSSKPAQHGSIASLAKEPSSHITISTSIDDWIAHPAPTTDAISSPAPSRVAPHSSPKAASPPRNSQLESSSELEDMVSSGSDKLGSVQTYTRQPQALKADSPVGHQSPGQQGLQDMRDSLAGAAGKERSERLAWLDGGNAGAGKKPGTSQLSTVRLSQPLMGYHQRFSSGALTAEPQHDMSEVLAVLNLLEDGSFPRDADNKALRPWSAIQAEHSAGQHSHAKTPLSAQHTSSTAHHHTRRNPDHALPRRSWEAPLEALSAQIEQRQAAGALRSQSPDPSHPASGWHSTRKPQRLSDEVPNVAGGAGFVWKTDMGALGFSDDKVSPYLQPVNIQFRARKVHPLTKPAGRERDAKLTETSPPANTSAV